MKGTMSKNEHPLRARIDRSGIRRPGPFLGAFSKRLGKKWNLYRQKLSGAKPITDRDGPWLDEIERILNHRDRYIKDNDGN